MSEHEFQPTSMLSGRCEFCNRPADEHDDPTPEEFADPANWHPIEEHPCMRQGALMSDDYWLRYRLSDLKAQIAREETLGRNTGLVHAAKRMVKHLERQMDMNKCYIGGCTCGKPKYDRQTEMDPKVLDESEKLNLSDWDKLNNEVTALFGNSRVHDKHILALFDKVGNLTMQDSIRGAGMSDLNERLGKLEGRLTNPAPTISAAGADSNIGVGNIKREMREMKATPRDEKSMCKCGCGSRSTIASIWPVRQDDSYGLTVTSPVGDDLGIMMREKNPSIVFHFGGKRLKFTLVNGKIGAEYNPDDLTAAAQTVVSEVERLLGVGCGADRSDDVRGDR